MRIRLSVVVAAAVLPGCWFFSPTSLDGFAEASIRAQCHFAFTCCNAEERAEFEQSLTFKDEGTCVDESLQDNNGTNLIIDRARAVVAANKGTFDQKRADECVKGQLDAENNCDAQSVLAPKPIADGLCGDDAIRGFVTGNVKDGAACNDDIECADYGSCDRSKKDPNTLTTEGTCKASKQEGDVCIDAANGVFFNCVPGNSCQQDAGDFKCKKDEKLDDGVSCSDGDQCKNGFCTESGKLACQIDGSDCTVDADCTNGDQCVPVGGLTCSGTAPKVDVCDGKSP